MKTTKQANALPEDEAAAIVEGVNGQYVVFGGGRVKVLAGGLAVSS